MIRQSQSARHRRIGMAAALGAFAAMATPAVADAPLFVLDRMLLPFDLGPGAPANNPARASNSPNSAWNSAGNTSNSPGVAANRPDHPANSTRLLITADGGVIGYYNTNPGGVLNLFDVSGKRIAFRPARGTKSLFTVTGQWCGTVDGTKDGGFALGVTRECAARFNR